MSPNESHSFRLTVLNPGGHDREQSFPDGAGEPGSAHAPVNFHAFAACTGGSFEREASRAIAQDAPVLLLLRGDFRAAQRALVALKKGKRTVAISLKETGLHQIAEQLRDPAKLLRFQNILAAADACVATTEEAAEIYRSLRSREDDERVTFIPTPYPIGDTRWDFSRANIERAGIFVGTREWNVPTRNHLAALLLARELTETTTQRVTVFNGEGRRGAKLLRTLNFGPDRLRVLENRLAYPDYLREVSRHRIVLQLDNSCVPGQVAGDALLCRMPCVGGNGAIDRIAFADTCGFGRSICEMNEIATRLLTDNAFYEQTISKSQTRAKKQIGFETIANQLRGFFQALGPLSPLPGGRGLGPPSNASQTPHLNPLPQGEKEERASK